MRDRVRERKAVGAIDCNVNCLFQLPQAVTNEITPRNGVIFLLNMVLNVVAAVIVSIFTTACFLFILLDLFE